jgi:Bacterial aa3 type cytochrome c oxidase subunit IV
MTIHNRGGIQMDSTQDSELQTHQEMWQNFLKLMGYGAAAVVVLLVLMAIFLL